MNEISKKMLLEHRHKIAMGNVMDLYEGRAKEGLVLDTFAASTMVARRTLWKYRTKGAFPSFRFLRAAAEFFRIHIVELLCSQDELREMLSDASIRRDDIQIGTTEVHYDIEYEQVLRTNLRRERCRRGMYPSELVRLAGNHISLMSHYRYEDKCDTYPLWHIFPVASVLGVSPLDLLTPNERRREIYGWLAEKYLPNGNSPSV
ncbi:MAG TPA: hypothetical protein VN420_03670 [Candidatus Fimivivens sp.]|nr:hypothetical protein [Candidatus Fimivivens sp.]